MNTNPHRRFLLCILFALPPVACSNGSKPGVRAVDAALPDAATTAGQGDTLPPGKDTGPDLVPDQAVSGVGLDTSADEAGPVSVLDASPGDARTCVWPSAIRYTLRHFDFKVTAPDGTVYSRARSTLDAGSFPPKSLSGVVTEAQGPMFKLDTCLPGTGCQPAVYSFRFCTDPDFLCGASSDVQVHMPIGKKIRVDWQLVAPVYFDVGTAFLAAYDQDDGVTRDALLLAGVGGLFVEDNATYKPDSLPFNFTLRRQNCGRSAADAAYQLGDDYTMIVVRKDGVGQSLALATGEAGSLDYTLPSGSLESVTVHCLSAVQPNATDDYWNWDFWLETPATASDGGAGP